MLAALFVAVLLGGQAGQQPVEVITAIRVQGNAVTAEDEVTRLSGLTIGEPLAADTISKAEAALRASKRFRQVEVLQRFASLDDPSQVLIVIIVDEGPLKLTGRGPGTTIARAGGPHLLFTPILSYEDGYGFTYGVRLAKPDIFGSSGRVSFPLTWGGDKRAGIDVNKELARGPLSRVQLSLFASKRTNPFDDVDDNRVGLRISGERDVIPQVRIGAWGSLQHVSFLDAHSRLTEGAVDVTLDTRHDPFLARNAVFGQAEIGYVSVAAGVAATRTSLEVRAYFGLVRQSILVVGVSRRGADHALPIYLEPLLGGIDSLRGFRAGYRIGDTVAHGTVELRVPLTSPLGIAKFGVRSFVDAGTAYREGEQLRDQAIDRGYGGGAWFTVTAVRLTLDLAHGVGAGTRIHFGSTISF